MKKNDLQSWEKLEISFSALVLFALVFFTYGILFKAPYSGFDFNPSEGRVDRVFVSTAPNASLQPGDTLIQIGDVSLQGYRQNRRLTLFENTQPGDVVNLLIHREGQELTIPWVYPGFNRNEFLGRFFNIWWLAFIFWFFGFMGQITLRPKDTRRRLFIASNYLTGLWLISGSLSAWHLFESSTLLHVISWLLLPVFLHLHWLFPRPLKGLSKNTTVFIYLLGIVPALGEAMHILPRSFYVLGLLGALIGSAVIELIHFVTQKDQRQNISLLTTAIALAFTPTIIFGLLILFGIFPSMGPVTLLALPFMPLAYFYIIYRSQFGGLEIRANRIVSIYAFMIVLGTALLLLVAPLALSTLTEGTTVFAVISVSSITAFVSILAFPSFQSYLEKNFLGIKFPHQNLAETYSARIAANTSINDLLRLLENDVFPSLLIRQFAFVQTSNGGLKALLVKNVAAEEIPLENRISQLVERSGKFIPAFSSDEKWIRLILPLKAGDAFIGFWLFGRRDPDDYYSQAEIPILQSIANQTAIALSYMTQTEHLKSIYQDGINQYEDERMRLALLLHDSILNELAALRMSLNETEVTQLFQKAYLKLTGQIREIIFNLRPPMLEYGLKPALEEMALTLKERNPEQVEIIMKIETDDSRYQAGNMEEHVFRMVQEACENALRHAQAKVIQITGRLLKDEISLSVKDDGKGFDTKGGLEIESLARQKHFGLAGILKRAQLIGAEVFIQSNLGMGTHIQVDWKPPPI